ncbi:20791_t:CDS:2 [Rhizophagus irregularis]|nr:20791_t:CDS:2 [Rhizophagus irregularis]
MNNNFNNLSQIAVTQATPTPVTYNNSMPNNNGVFIPSNNNYQQCDVSNNIPNNQYQQCISTNNNDTFHQQNNTSNNTPDLPQPQYNVSPLLNSLGININSPQTTIIIIPVSSSEIQNRLLQDLNHSSSKTNS